MQHEVIGKIVKIFNESSGKTNKGDDWKKIEFLVKTSENYNSEYPFEVFGSGEHVSKVENFKKYNKVGNNVKVTFNVNAREYEGKYYTNLSAWRVDNQSNVEEPATSSVAAIDDDLPF